MTKKVHGFGINDATYKVALNIEGKYTVCPFYDTWKHVLERSCSEAFKMKLDCYEKVSVNTEWEYFTDFKGWMESQVWEGLHLDKDILIMGNKEYSSKTCCFIPHWLNKIFTIKNHSKKSELPIGVDFIKRSGKFRARVSNGEGRSIGLGYHKSASDAHRAWQLGKIVVIESAIDKYRLEKCYRPDVEKALLERVDLLKFHMNNNIITETL